MSAHQLAAIPVIFFLFFPLFTTGNYPCSEGFNLEVHKRSMKHCHKKTLGVEFGWNYHNETSRLDILVGARLYSEMGWLAWGLNPGKEPKMVGSRALIGIKQENGTLVCHTYNITHFTKIGCPLQPSKIDLEVPNFKFFYIDSIAFYVIEATIILTPKYNVSRINLVWQVGQFSVGLAPKMHHTKLANLDCKQTIDLVSGSVRSVRDHKRHALRMAHGILNIVGWGTFLPIGVIVARYFRRHPVPCSRWFNFHISCQIVGWIIGTCGWIIGLWLANASKSYGFRTHRILAIIIFTFTTLQMLALRLRPSKNDAYRIPWNMYHHFLGYSLLAIISFNIFQGIAIISADHTWKWAYIGLLCLLAVTALSLEICSWVKFWVNKDTKELGRKEKSPSGNQVANKTSPGPAEGSIPGAQNVSQPNDGTDPTAKTSFNCQPWCCSKAD